MIYLLILNLFYFFLLQNSGNVDWLNYEPDNQLIIGTPEKEDVGRSNVTITVSPSSCSTLLPWTVSVTFLVELPKQTDSSASGTCVWYII